MSYTFNLTPEPNTGLGIWTEEMFVQAIRTGKHMGTSRPINPPMPWPAYRNATDEDLKAVYAYLRTIKPVVNHGRLISRLRSDVHVRGSLGIDITRT